MTTTHATTTPALLFAILGAACATAPTPAAAADAEHGKALYQTCIACHTERPDAIGPSLKGVFGRKSAALDNYRYSNPMKRANLTWDAANLRDYIVDPQARIKGNRMPFAGVKNPKDADDLVAFLEDYK
jgi:cytochrome c